MKLKTTLAIIVCLSLLSCSIDGDEIINNTDQSEFIIQIGGGTAGDPTNNSFQTDLMAGQNMLAGVVNVNVVDDVIVVSYSSDSGWEIQETHLYVGDLGSLPTNGGGNPKIGQFPYKDTHNAGTIDVVYNTITIAPGDCVFIAAHAVVENTSTGQNETAWGDGVPIGGNSWAMMFEFCN